MWHYTCNNKTFDFKFSAIDEHLKNKQPIHFHAPAEYNTFEFSVEPNETWATLLKNEALKLRETYQFIKLWYSGGADRDAPGQKLVDQATEFGWSVAFPEWDKTVGDVADAVLKYGRLFTIQSILKTTESSKLKIDLKRKMYG